MSENNAFGFANLVPGFDFLQNLAKNAPSNLSPQMPNLSNWVAPTLNVEELEKRIAELKAVQFWLDQNGKALAATIQALEVQKMTLATLQGMNFRMGEVADALKLDPSAAKAKAAAKPAKGGNAGNAGAAPVDPLQWWGALTQQFQQIAANAMKDVAETTAQAAPAPAAASKKTAARKSPARKKPAQP